MKERKRLIRWLLAAVAVFMITMAGTALADETISLGTLVKGQKVFRSGEYQGNCVYFGINVPAAGYLNVNGYGIPLSGTGSYGLDIMLCNASGTPIDYSSFNYPNGGKGDNDIIYGVTAGTYMIRVRSVSNKYYFGIQFTQKKNQAKYSKGKALNMKKGKKYSVVLGAGDRRTCWLKLQAPGSKKVMVTVKGFGQGNYDIKFTGSKMNASDSLYNNQTNKWKLYTKVGFRERALRKGTYYIKIARRSGSSGYSNGWLQVSWKLAK